MSPSKTILVALATVVIFAAGVVTGGLLVRQTTPRPPPPAGNVPFLGRVESIHRTASQLDLSPDQRRRINEIVRNSREQIADYFMILEPDIQQVFRDMRQQIRATLTPAQRNEFEELMRRRLGRPGPVPDGPRPGSGADRRPGNFPQRPPPGPTPNPPEP